MSVSLSIKLGVPPVMYATIKAIALLGLGRYDAAAESLQQEIAHEQYPLGKALQAFGEGLRLTQLMAFEAATQILEDVVAQAKHVGRVWLQVWAEAELSLCLLRCERTDEINLAWMQRDLARTATSVLAAAPQLLGEIALEKGDFDGALRRAEQARGEAEKFGWKPAALAALEMELRTLLELERHADVIAQANVALALATEIEQPSLKWRILLAKAQALAALASAEAAAEEYRKSAAIVRALAETIDDAQLKRSFFSNPMVAMAVERG